MQQLQGWFEFISSIIMLIGVIILVYRSVNDPDTKNKEGIYSINQRCKQTHEYLNKDVTDIKCMILKFEENHMNHIEPDLKKVQIDIARILAVLKIDKD